MLDDTWSPTSWAAPRGDQAPSGLPPEAPLAMPPQILERRRRRRSWLRLLARRAG